MKIVLTGLVLGGALLASTATATSVTFRSEQPLSDAPISGALSLSKFDPSLGTLTAVLWRITGTMADVLSLTPDGGASYSGWVASQMYFDVSAPELNLVATPFFSSDFLASATTPVVTLQVGEVAVVPLAAMKTISRYAAPGAAFQGAGTIDLSYDAHPSLLGNNFMGDVAVSQSPEAGIDFEITYYYDHPVVTEVPLPASLVLLAGALGTSSILVLRRQHGI